MAKIKNLVSGNRFIGMGITSSEYQLSFGDDLFTTSFSENLPYWNGVPFLLEGDVTEYSLPIAGVEGINNTLGGVIVGSGLLITSGGVLSVDPIKLNYLRDLLDPVYAEIVHDHVWADITDAPTSLGFFSNATTNFQNLSQVTKIVEDAIGELEYVLDVYVSDGTDEYVNGDLVVVKEDGSKTKLWNMIVETHIAVVKGQDIIDINTDNSLGLDVSGVDPAMDYIVIEFGEATMTWTELEIPVYEGTDPTTGIQVIVNGGNKISAILKANSVSRAQLEQGLRDELDSKMELQNEANLGTGNAAKVDNLAIFNSAGQAVDSGKSIQDVLEEVDMERVDDLEKKVDELEQEFEDHDHDGTNSKKVDYTNLLNVPVYKIPVNLGGGARTIPLGLPSGSKGAIVNYVAQRGSDEEMGTLNYMLDSRECRQINVFDNTDGEGIDMGIGESVTPGAIDIVNNGSGFVDILLTVTVI